MRRGGQDQTNTIHTFSTQNNISLHTSRLYRYNFFQNIFTATYSKRFKTLYCSVSRTLVMKNKISISDICYGKLLKVECNARPIEFFFSIRFCTRTSNIYQSPSAPPPLIVSTISRKLWDQQ